MFQDMANWLQRLFFVSCFVPQPILEDDTIVLHSNESCCHTCSCACHLSARNFFLIFFTSVQSLSSMNYSHVLASICIVLSWCTKRVHFRKTWCLFFSATVCPVMLPNQSWLAQAFAVCICLLFPIFPDDDEECVLVTMSFCFPMLP